MIFPSSLSSYLSNSQFGCNSVILFLQFLHTPNHYIIDTCSLVALNRHNPIDVFPTVWRKLSHLVHGNLLHSPIAVLLELQKQDDQIVTWANQHKKMFISESSTQVNVVRDIMRDYTALVDINKDFSADPWLIAVAHELVTSLQMTMYPDTIIVVKVKAQLRVLKYQCKVGIH